MTAVRLTLVTLLSAISCAGCMTTPPIDSIKTAQSALAIERRGHFTGCWFSDMPVKDGSRRQTLMQRSREGRFEFTYRFLKNGEITPERTEFGRWGLSWPIYFAITEGWGKAGRKRYADSRDGYFDDAYQVTELTADSLHYHDFRGNRYVSRKLHGACAFPSRT